MAEAEGIGAQTAYEPMAASTGANRLFRDAFPLTFDGRADDLYLLHPDEAKTMSDEDVRYLLTQRVITDGETLIELARRGVALGVRAEVIDSMEAVALHEKYTDHPMNAGEDVWKSSYYVGGRQTCCRLYDDTGRAEVLGTYVGSTLRDPESGKIITPHGIAELVIDTAEGGKWAVIGYQPWKGAISKARRDHVLALYDYVAKAPLCARMVTPHQAILHPRVDESGKTVCVSVTNCSIGRLIGGTLAIRSPKGERFAFVSQYAPAVELCARREGDAYYVDLPELAAWTQGTLFCE